MRVSKIFLAKSKYLCFKAWLIKHSFFITALICVPLLLIRVIIGVDITDESYYATFIDGWYKVGLSKNPTLMMHQTAALLVWPFAKIFLTINQSTDGLILFLRLIYLFCTFLTALVVHRFFLVLSGALVASFLAAVTFFFVPFGLPAPSYNSLGMLSMTSALALFAIPFIQENSSNLANSFLLKKIYAMPFSLWISSALWGVACVAYPSMIIPLVVFLSLIAINKLRLGGAYIVRYTFITLLILFFLLLILAISLEPKHLWRAVEFTSATTNISGGLVRKFQNFQELLFGQKLFIVKVLAAFIVAILCCIDSKKKFPVSFGPLGLLLLVIWAINSKVPSLFAHSHDLIFLLTLVGTIVLGWNFFQPYKKNLIWFTINIVFFVSLIAGICTAATSNNGVINFPIGGFFACCISLFILLPIKNLDGNISAELGERYPMEYYTAIINPLIFFVVIMCFLKTSFGFLYGQYDPISFNRYSIIKNSVFSGIFTDPEKALYIQEVAQILNNQKKCGNKILVLGTGPVYYLLTSMIPVTLSTWGITQQDDRNFAIIAEEDFFAQQENLPNTIVVNRWSYANPLTPVEKSLLEGYESVKTFSRGIYSVQIFQNLECAHF